MELFFGHRESQCQTRWTNWNKLAFPFLWNSINLKLCKRESLLITFADRGLDIVDIKTKIESLFAKQVLQLIKEHRAKWTFLAVYWLGIHLKEYVASFPHYLFRFQNKYPTRPRITKVCPTIDFYPNVSMRNCRPPIYRPGMENSTLDNTYPKFAMWMSFVETTLF